uniref:F-box domain-containing protein n=2 Tax=Leersia perrieri TaxID=77586 RepID=A0A0D9VQX7_9ORYZ
MPTAIRTSFLSTRWRHLPSLLSQMSLNISDFMCSNSTQINHTVIDKAMVALMKETRVCLAAPGTDKYVTTLSLRFCPSAKYLSHIGGFVCKAIENGKVKAVELALPTEKKSLDCDAADKLQHAHNIVSFSHAYPSLFGCFTRLFLHNARFSELEMHYLLGCCKEPQHLMLTNCDTGERSVLKLDVPNSKLSSLKFKLCRFEMIELLCLPKLSQLYCECWISVNAPFSFGTVPCLEDLCFASSAGWYQCGLKLSELLHGTTSIQSLTLDFQGEKIWILPEGKKFYTFFNKLNKLFIHGISIEFNLLWTIIFLEAAPSLETFGVKVWDHLCDVDNETTRKAFSKRKNPWQRKDKMDGSRHLKLKSLEFGGFMTTNKRIEFIKTIVAHAPNLESIVLENKDSCKSCDDVKDRTCSIKNMFPKNKGEEDTVRKRLRDQDRFNQLPDDILMSILERVDMRTVLQTSVLSTRWKQLPVLLSHFNLDVDEFITPNSSMSSNEAMAILIKLMSSLFGSAQRESTIRRLSLNFCLLTDLVTSLKYLFNISELVCNAVDSGKVKSVELAITTEKRVVDYTTGDMVLHAKSLLEFFGVSRSLSCCLTKLFLSTARFSEPDLHQLMISCDQLQHVTLYHCELSDSSILKFDMPKSKLRFVELYSCYIKTVEFLCLPKLEQLNCDSWRLSGPPLSFGVVPCLEQLQLVCAKSRVQSGFKLTDLLCGTANVHDLVLDFQGEEIWITPEGNELHTALKRITKLFLCGIYVKFDLLWTLLLLQAAPSVKIFGVKVWNHACDEGTQRSELFSERRNDLWDAAQLDDSIHYLQLEKLEFGGFNPIIKEHLDLIRAVIEHAPKLRSVILEDIEPCEDCEAVDCPIYPSTTSMFPQNKDEKSRVVKQLKAGISRPVEIIFQ